MKEIIATGKTVEQALEAACAELGVSSDEVNYEVLEVPVKKFFKSIPAKVRVTYGEEEVVVPKEEPKAAVSVKKPEPKKEAAPKKEQAPKAESAPQKQAEPQPKKQAEAPAMPATGEKADAAVAFMKEVIAAMGVEVDAVSAVKQGEATIIRVEGEKVGALIGRRGETMEALSYLTGLVANRTGGDYEKIGLDVAGYRSKREQDLAALARRVGAKVQKTGRSQALEPMNPYERRIIHSVIGEMENLSSESTGEGAARRVVVRSTAPGAVDGGERNRGGRNRGGRGRGGKPRQAAPHQDRPERKAPTGEAPVAVPRSTTLDEKIDLPLYGKIEF